MPSIGSLCVGSFYSFIFSMLQLLSWKVTFFSTQKPTPSDWVHCEVETGVYYQLSRFTYILVKKNYTFLKFVILPQKIHTFSKIP